MKIITIILILLAGCMLFFIIRSWIGLLCFTRTFDISRDERVIHIRLRLTPTRLARLFRFKEHVILYWRERNQFLEWRYAGSGKAVDTMDLINRCTLEDELKRQDANARVFDF